MLEATAIPGSIFAYIWRYSKGRQLVLVIGTLLYLPLLYAFFELPKMIINGALQPPAGTFPGKLLWGMPVSQVEYLMLLCLALLGLMLVTAGLRYVLSVEKGVLGEVMLRRLRYDLFTQILRFPLPHFRRVSGGEIVTMATAEAEPIGRYMGVAVANPVLQAGTLATAMTFLFVQDWVLGLAAIALFPIQAIIVPKLQQRMNEESRRRLANVRLFAGHISESISGVREIHAHDTSIFERARASDRLGVLFRIRRRLYKLGNAIIFLNSFFTQLTPFLFYLIGGYLVIMSDLTIGALVAVIGAYRETVQPWNELLENYQQLEDNRVKYAALVENFVPASQRSLPDTGRDEGCTLVLAGALEVSGVTLAEGDTRLLDDVSLVAVMPGRLAIVGPAGSGKSELAQLLCGLLRPGAGSVRIGGRDVGGMTPEEIGYCFGYVDQDSHVFGGTWRDNLLYGVQHRPVCPPSYSGEESLQREIWVREALAAGNAPLDLAADWADYASLGLADRAGLDRRIAEVVRLVGLEGDLMNAGLRALPAAGDDAMPSVRLLRARRRLHETLMQAGYGESVELFHEDRFAMNATLGENFLFGRPTDETLDIDHLGSNAFVLDVLARHGLLERMVEVGRLTAEAVIEMFRDLPPGDERLDRLSLIPRAEMPRFQAILMRLAGRASARPRPDEQAMLLSLAFAQAPAHQRFGLIDEALCAAIVAARKTFRDNLPEALHSKVEFFDPERVCGGVTVQCNLLFGRIAKSQDRATLDAMMREAVASAGLSADVMALGLASAVGTSGAHLSPPQRQKLSLARCLVKRPSILIVNEAVNALDREEQEAILGCIVEYLDGRGLVWVDREGAGLRQFDAVVTMRGGRVLKTEGQGHPAAGEAVETAAAGETVDAAMRILVTAPVLDGVDSSTARILAYAGDQQRFRPGEDVVRAGEPGESCYFVLEGVAEVSVGGSGGRTVVAALGPGEVVGETALLLNEPRSATVTAATDLLVLRLPRDLFGDLLRKDDKFGLAMMRTLARRLVDTTKPRDGAAASHRGRQPQGEVRHG
jgi:ABC-type multidrug transport system fused ATPase/permease subunit